MPDTTASIEVSVPELKGALKSLKKVTKSGGAEAVLRFQDDLLAINLGGVEVAVEARGAWKGQARVPGDWLIKVLPKYPLAGELILVFVKDDRLHMKLSESLMLSVACEWQDIGWAPIELPMDPPFGLLLAVDLKYTDSDIINSGLVDLIQGAADRKERLIEKAHDVLSPFGVEPRELEELVDKRILAQFGHLLR